MTGRADIIAEGIRHREESRDHVNMRGLDRIDISVVGELAYRAKNPREPDGDMHIGEPVDRGGDGIGASPLSHFLTGAGACLLNQFVRVAVAEGHPVVFTGASVRGEFRREAGGAFERITCEIRANGALPSNVAARLAERAQHLCYVHQTLKRTVELITVLVLDGAEIVRHVDGPSGPSFSEGR